MRETRSSGSVRGASGDGRPYRERKLVVHPGPGEGLLSTHPGRSPWPPWTPCLGCFAAVHGPRWKAHRLRPLLTGGHVDGDTAVLCQARQTAAAAPTRRRFLARTAPRSPGASAVVSALIAVLVGRASPGSP